MPFWMTSWAAPMSWATLGLTSYVCGSVFGLLSMEVTDDVLSADLGGDVAVLVLGGHDRDGSLTLPGWPSHRSAVTRPIRQSPAASQGNDEADEEAGCS